MTTVLQGEVKGGGVVLPQGASLPDGTIVKVEPLEVAATKPAQDVPRRRFQDHFGAVSLGHSTGVDNEGIDADLSSQIHEERSYAT